MCRIRALVYATVLSSLLVSAPVELRAQAADTMPQRGVYPNGSYTFDKIESINQVNGILTISIPLTSMPLGRGGMTVPVNLTYSSALWDTYYYNVWNGPSVTTYSELKDSQWGGWSITGFNYALIEDFAGTVNCSAVEPVYRLNVVLPDGSHHPLKLYDEWDDNGDSRYWFDPSNGGKNLCNNTSYPLSSMPYYTSDGTYIKDRKSVV